MDGEVLVVGVVGGLALEDFLVAGGGLLLCACLAHLTGYVVSALDVARGELLLLLLLQVGAFIYININKLRNLLRCNTLFS